MFSRSAHDTSGLLLLNDLMADGGGFITGMLDRLDMDVGAIRSAMQQPKSVAAATPAPYLDAPMTGKKDHSYEAFVPVSVNQVWELLDAPERRPEWDITIDTIEPDGDKQWKGCTTNTQLRAARSGRVRIFRLTHREEYRSLEWEQHLPLLRRSRPTRLMIHLAAQAGGTQLLLTMRRPRSVVPLPGFFFTIVLSAYANSISRAVRS